MKKPKYKYIDGRRHMLVSYDIMLNKGTRFFKTVTDYFPMSFSLEIGQWHLDCDDFVADAKSRWESLKNKEFTIAFNEV